MSTYTTNYNFEKPEGTDYVSPTPYNNNFDSIDQIFKDYTTTTDAAIDEINDTLYNDVITDDNLGWQTGTGLQYVEFTSSGTWTAPYGIKDNKIWAIAFGGGGGAAGSYYVNSGTDKSSAKYGGAGGGGYMDAGIFTVVPGQSYEVTIGAGGSGGTAYYNSYKLYNGGRGGTTTFMGLSADGGYGGKRVAYSSDGSYQGTSWTGWTKPDGGDGGSGGGGGTHDDGYNYLERTGDGGNGSYGGGGGAGSYVFSSYPGDTSEAVIRGGNGGTFGGGGGCTPTNPSQYNNVQGIGGTYGGNGGFALQTSSNIPKADDGTIAIPNSVFYKKILPDSTVAYRREDMIYDAPGGTANYSACGGGGGYGSAGGSPNIGSSYGNGGGGGFFSNGGVCSSSYQRGPGGGGGGFFATGILSGGGGYFSNGSGRSCAAGGNVTRGSGNSGGSGVVGIWYFIEKNNDSIDLIFQEG